MNDTRSNKKKAPNNDEEDNTSLLLPLKEGKVTGFPKDLTSAPAEITLSKKIHDSGKEALEQTVKSGEEHGFFLHLDETGQILPGEVRPPSEKSGEGEWITQDEYIQLKKQDQSIHGHLHIHPKEPEFPETELAFSVGNLGLFLMAQDTIYVCTGEQGTYLVLLRSQQTDSPREGLAEEATFAYLQLVRNKTKHHIKNGMVQNQAISQAVYDTMIDLCKRYKIILYQGEDRMIAQKLV